MFTLTVSFIKLLLRNTGGLLLADSVSVASPDSSHRHQQQVYHADERVLSEA